MAAISAAGAGYSWLATANEVAQLFATAVAIVAGLYAIKWHKAKIADIDKKVDAVNEALERNQCLRNGCPRRTYAPQEDDE